MENKTKPVSSIVKSSNDITSSFAKLKFVTLSCLICVAATAVICVVYSLSTMKGYADKIYVVDQGQAITATRQDALVTRADEANFFVKDVHGLLFNVSGNREVVTHNLEKVLNVCGDRSVYNFYKNLEERSFYRNMMTSNAVQEIIVDSVKTNMRAYPYQVRAYSTVYKTRQSIMTKNTMVTEMSLLNVPRNVNNPNGFKLENFNVISDTEIEKRKRQ